MGFISTVGVAMIVGITGSGVGVGKDAGVTDGPRSCARRKMRSMNINTTAMPKTMIIFFCEGFMLSSPFRWSRSSPPEAQYTPL